MKPFDLKLALAGNPVVTGQGYRVKISGHNPEAKKFATIVGWIYLDEQYPEACAWTDSGECAGTNEKDLFMAPSKKKGWVALNHNPKSIMQRIHVGSVYASLVYATEEDARRCSGGGDMYPIVPIEWEE